MLSVTHLLWIGLGALLLRVPVFSQPTFIGFFPCLPNTGNISTQEDAQSCDIFVYAAVKLALDKIRANFRKQSELESVILELETSNSENIIDVSCSLT